jgi:hypothetical protein
MTGTGLVKSEDDNQMGEAGDVLQPGGIGRVDLDLTSDVGEAVGPVIPARIDVLSCLERRMDDADSSKSNQSLIEVSHFS